MRKVILNKIVKFNIKLCSISVFLFVLLFSPIRVQGVRTIVVPSEYRTINEAVGAASNGDTVYIMGGTYYERISIQKSITIKGENRDKVKICGVNSTAFDIWGGAVTIKDITVYESGYAIMSGHHDNLNLDNVLIKNNELGLRLNGYELSVSLNNVVFDSNELGIYTYCIENLIMKNCMFSNNGKDIDIHPETYFQYNIDIDKSNNFNGKYFYIFKGKNGIGIPDDACTIVLVNCSNLSVNNIKIHNSYLGIYLYNCKDINIENNEISNCVKPIFIQDSKNIVINNNKLINNNDGIKINNARNSKITNNILQNLDNNIYITVLYNSTINNNIIQSKDYKGKGISISDSNDNVIKSNIMSNLANGIEIQNSNFNIFYRNELNNNANAVSITNSFSNEIVENNFIKNKSNIKNVKVVNIFDKNNRGNYWDNFISEDINKDGILDTPYIIERIRINLVFCLYPSN